MKHLFWSFLNTFVGQGFNTIFAIILGNLLLPATLGYYVTIMLVVRYGVALGSLQAGGAIVYYLNNVRQSETGRYLSAGWSVVSITALAATGICFAFYQQILGALDAVEKAEILWVFIPLILLQANRMYLNRVLQSAQKFKFQALANFAASFLQVLTAVILVGIGLELIGIVISLYLANITGVILAGVYAVKLYGATAKGIGEPIKKVGRFAGISHLSRVSVFLDKNIDLLFVTYFLSKATVAEYNYAIKFALVFLLIGNSVSRVSFPKLAKAFANDDRHEVERVYGTCVDASFVLFSILVAGLVIHAEWLIDLILPRSYIAIVPALTVLLCGLLLKSTTSTVGALFSAKGKPGYGVWVNASVLLVNIVLSILLIPRYGMIGAAVATGSSFTLKGILSLLMAKFKLGIEYHFSKLGVNFVCCLGVVFALHYLLSNYLLQLVLLLAYLGAELYLFLGVAQMKDLWGKFRSAIAC